MKTEEEKTIDLQGKIEFFSNFLKKGLTVENKNGKWWIIKHINTISFYDLEGSIQRACATLQGIRLPEGFDVVDLRAHEYEKGYELVAVALRQATEAETLIIQQEEDSKKKINKEWRKKQYETLKNEFGPDM